MTTGRVGHRLVGGPLQRHGRAAPPGLVLRDQHLAAHVVQARRERVGGEAAEDDGVRRAEPRAGEHRDRRLRDHPHVDPDRGALPHAELLQRVRERDHLAQQVGVGQSRAVAVGLALPVEGDLVAAPRLDVAVDAVVRDVQLAAEVPLRVRQLPLVELRERLEPRRRARAPRAPRTPRSPRRRSPGCAFAAARTPAAADSAAPRGAACRSSAGLGSTSVLRLEVVRVLRQVLGAVVGDEHEVLEPHAAVALPVEARLDRDDVAGAQRAPSTRAPGRAARAPRARRRGRARGRSRPRASCRAPSCAGSASRPPRRCRRCRRRPPRPSAPSRIAASAASSASLQSECQRATSSGTSPTTNVRVMSAKQARLVVARPDVDHDRHPGANRAAAEVVADRALRARRDDEVVGSRAVRDERLRHRRLDPLDGERLAVDARPSPFGVARRSRSRAASIPASAARCARRIPASSAAVLTRRRSSKKLAVGRQLDALARAAGRRARAGRSPARPRSSRRAP